MIKRIKYQLTANNNIDLVSQGGFKLQNELAIFQVFYADVRYSKSYELHTCTYIYFTCLRNYMKFVCIYVVFLSEPYTFITDYIILRIRTQLCNDLDDSQN